MVRRLDDYECQFQLNEQTSRNQNADAASSNTEIVGEGQEDFSTDIPRENYTYEPPAAVDEITEGYQNLSVSNNLSSYSNTAAGPSYSYPVNTTTYSATTSPVQYTSPPAQSTSIYNLQTSALPQGSSGNSSSQGYNTSTRISVVSSVTKKGEYR